MEGRAPTEAARRTVEALRPRFEREGYSFEPYPEPSRLPEFMGRYRPDAVARRGAGGVAIEVLARRGEAAVDELRRARRVFEGQPEWRFHVVVPAEEPGAETAIPAGTAAEVLDRVAEAEGALAAGRRRAAFVESWALLEAAFRLSRAETEGRPYAPGSVVQALAMDGLITPEADRALRGLIDLRNRIVHGDLRAEPTEAEVASVLDGVRAALGLAEAASA